MASGALVGAPMGIGFPSTLSATPTVLEGASTPKENFSLFDFDDATDEYIDIHGGLHGYDGGGITILLRYTAAAASGKVVWRAAFRRIADDADDLDTTAHTYVYNTVNPTVAGTIGEVDFTTITFTNGADMDSLADGEEFVLRIGREATDTTNDTLTGDARLKSFYITET